MMPKNKSEILEKYIYMLLKKQYNLKIVEDIFPFMNSKELMISDELSYNDIYEILNTVDICDITIYDKDIPFKEIGKITYETHLRNNGSTYLIYEVTMELVKLFEETENLYNMGVLPDYVA